MKNLLLVEDDSILGATLTENLQLEGYSVDWIQSGEKAMNASHSKIFDLILLDLMLPEKNGFEILEHLRKEKQNAPVMILSARSSLQDKERAFELYADDYITKPFHLSELLHRVKALLRRAERKNDEKYEVLEFHNCKVHLQTGVIEFSNQKEEVLSEKELKLLQLFYARKNTKISREEILNAVWGINQYPSPRSIDNFILKFRKLFEKESSNPSYFLSHRGYGYSFQWKEVKNEF